MSEDELLELRLKEIDWKTVDKFPTTADCENIVDEKLQLKCLFDFFKQTIKENLKHDTLSKFYPKQTILNIQVTVSPNERLVLESVITNDSLLKNKTKIDSILDRSLKGFPLVNPATKRGIPVKTKFIIPFEIEK